MIFGEELQAWYQLHKRDLPWRETKDAYKIWLSEIILQQTRVEQGLPYYLRFVERFNTVVDFANADEDDILHLWQGLGYYSRGRNMHKAARIVRDQYNGVFPVDYKTLLSLPGIGEYTAAAISSFANNEAQAVLDGNVFRVLARYYGIETPINSTEGKKIFTALAKENLDQNHPALYNQAIMDFGAIHCKPKQPLCEQCMFRLSCYALTRDEVDQLPVKLKGKASKDRYFNYFILRDNDKILMSKRGEGDVWQNLYEFPLLESNHTMDIPEILEDDWFVSYFGHGTHLNILQKQTKHILSHQNIYATFFEVRLKGDLIQKKSNWDYVILKDLDKLAKHKLIFTFLERSNF
ncbi:A/G-specific adenine glycosylase [Sphingobacterium sp. UGAL515B_05]|uniref:A/G-specific adenine glycosylase n=1 Tax=Sphingobacterium sp. UGAL515B_05 TaxID=2986767 RepID=UPI002952B3AE|nr:A/G-specific adenine glycosylase [Sphingobacterium sp. UGAL515B_05]WON95887.1 A/G-specific adenine glycosylase [Sphingobacterium sp. UGAL515B_05]